MFASLFEINFQTIGGVRFASISKLHFNHMLVFLTQLCELLTLQSSLQFHSFPPHHLPCVNKYKVCIHYIVCKGGLRQINTCSKVPLQVNFLDDVILLWCLYSQLVHAANFSKQRRWSNSNKYRRLEQNIPRHAESGSRFALLRK